MGDRKYQRGSTQLFKRGVMINNVNNFLSMEEFNKTGGMKRVNWEVQHGRANTRFGPTKST